jgi:hypothetical protein
MRSRSFNTIEVFPEKGLVRKSSTEVEKLRAEVLFYLNAPKEMQSNMPMLREYAGDYSWYDMDYIEYKTLSEMATESELPWGSWYSVFKLIAGTLSSPDADLGTVDFTDLYKIFVSKAINRARGLDHNELKKIFFAGSTINGKKMKSLANLLIANCGVLFKVDAAMAVTHGDLCFSNILISDDLQRIKIIDPRGGFDEPSIFGPVVYDTAKLAQSMYTWYDKIVEGQYSLGRSDYGYTLESTTPDWSTIAGPAFFATFKDVTLTEQDLRVLGALMLAGTPALHLDDPNRAVALALNAVLLLSGDSR